eukprot:TRINITY_DN2597_c0_g2_i2.p1 TRINITY_DN2597_c0_g2~~TRINITY_DN2597_c0_g2_i2.p1  ORF type:complete len:408 (-),score=90.50 TRINITY_DN2597_c0_g2_i2:23-1153(-)
MATTQSSESATIQSIRYSRGSLELLDQKLLPDVVKYENISNTEEGWEAIRSMKVRGAPALAIAGVLSLAVEVNKLLQPLQLTTPEAVVKFISEKLAYLKTSRPTAVNLFEATDRLTNVIVSKSSSVSGEEGAKQLLELYLTEAEAMLEDDVASNKSMGNFGADILTSLVKDKPLKVLTHCNTGSLATAGYGTALGVIRALHERSKLERAFCTETRPYNQGARLTALEFVHDKIPGTLVTDSMVSALMLLQGIDAVVVGADRVTANGDTANKVGTYQVAIAAKYHNIPFFVAAPVTTLDCNLKSGKDIVIEQRPANELTTLNGIKLAPDQIGVWNPAFDVTPSTLITGIITERGVIHPNDQGVFDVPSFLSSSTPNK